MKRSRLNKALMVSCIAVMGLTACQKPLFPPNTHRSQYERYALLRGQLRPATQPDQFGAERPALRNRLRPMEQTSSY